MAAARVVGLLLLVVFLPSLQPLMAAASGYLAGSIGGFVVLTPGVYRVRGNLTIDPGGVLVVEPGSVLVFEPSSRLIVRGRVVVEGSAIEPVVFMAGGGLGAVRMIVEGGVFEAWWLRVRGVLVFEGVDGGMLRLSRVNVYYGEGPGPILFNCSISGSSIVFEGLRAARVFYGSLGGRTAINDSLIVFNGSNVITIGFFNSAWRGVGLEVYGSRIHYGVVYRYLNASRLPVVESSWLVLNRSAADSLAFMVSGSGAGGCFFQGLSVAVDSSRLDGLGFTLYPGSRLNGLVYMLNSSNIAVMGSRVGYVSIGGSWGGLSGSSVMIRGSRVRSLVVAARGPPAPGPVAANYSSIVVESSRVDGIRIYSVAERGGVVRGGAALLDSLVSVSRSILGGFEAWYLVNGSVGGFDGWGLHGWRGPLPGLVDSRLEVSDSVFLRSGINISMVLRGAVLVNASSFIGTPFGVAVNTSRDGLIEVHYCNMYGVGVGVEAGDAEPSVNATLDWWGGSSVSGDVVYEPSLPGPAGQGRLNVSITPSSRLLGVDEPVEVEAVARGSGRVPVGYMYSFGDGSSTGLSVNSTATYSYGYEGSYNITVRVLDNYGSWWNASIDVLVCREEPVKPLIPRTVNSTAFNVSWLLGVHCNVSRVSVRVYRVGGGLVEEANATGQEARLDLPPGRYRVVVEVCSGPYCSSTGGVVVVDTSPPRVELQGHRILGGVDALRIGFSDDFNVTMLNVTVEGYTLVFTPYAASGAVVVAAPRGSTVAVTCIDEAGNRVVRVFKAP